MRRIRMLKNVKVKGATGWSMDFSGGKYYSANNAKLLPDESYEYETQAHEEDENIQEDAPDKKTYATVFAGWTRKRNIEGLE